MKTKQVMKVEMYGRTLVIKQNFGTKFEFRVFEVFPNFRNDYHLGSFESFQEAYECVTSELWG